MNSVKKQARVAGVLYLLASAPVWAFWWRDYKETAGESGP